jgi:hypothetical protein
MTKGLISIFALPEEIDDLHITLYNLKRNMSMLPRDIKMDIDLTFCMSGELTNWDATQLPQSYFIEKFNALRPLMDWSANPKIHVEFGDTILGCVAQRRSSLQFLREYDFTIWLDCDMFFNDTTILYLASSFRAAKNAGASNFIITPQFVRQWDASWDHIVHPSYRTQPLMYHESADIIQDGLYDLGDVNLSLIDGFKFAGGWCTLLSNDLLELIGVPEAFGHYGMEDTFIVEVCKYLQGNNHSSNPRQYVLTNHIVGENYKYRTNKHLKTMVVSRNKKEIFRANAFKNFGSELKKVIERVMT